KHAVGRPRPFLALDDLHVLLGRGKSFGMPSAHAANMFAATMVLFLYYRRSLWFMLPLALLVSYSRIYTGMHYPGDVLAGIILGSGYAVAGVWGFNALWQWAGRKWFPLWWEKVPSLVIADCGLRIADLKTASPDQSAAGQSAIRNPQSTIEQHWLRLGYVVIIVGTLLRLAFLRSGSIELTGDEAYQWTWSKHPALSYVSKP